MKSINFLFSCAFCFLISSCNFSDMTNVEREELIGSWNLSKSTGETERKTTDSIVVTGFQLYADSTVVALVTTARKKMKVEGVWYEKSEAKIGNSTFSMALSNDVTIVFNEKVGGGFRIMGLMLQHRTDGKLCLECTDKIYEKQQ